jgi:CRP-like cAMP-binding protein
MSIYGYDRSVYLTYLKQVPMFRECTTAELEEVANLASPRSASVGDELVRQGDPGDEFFVLCTGEAKVTRDGDEVAALREGDFFGEIALFADEPRDATVSATHPATLVVLSRADFEQVLGDVPSIREQLLRGMARRLHELDGRF